MFPQFDRDRDRRDQDRRDFRRWPFDFFPIFPPITPGFPPQQQRPQYGLPSGPPPAFIPQEPPIGTLAVDPGAINNCLFRFTYIWPARVSPFWFFPTFVGPRSIAGFRWTGFTWVFFGMDLRDIRSFQCF